jgi:hypothetical protein
MHLIKIKNFESEHPGNRFPWFQSLDAAETRQVRDALTCGFGAQEANGLLGLTEFLDGKAGKVGETSAESDNFDLRDVFRQLGISPLTEVLINWYRFDEIDRMRLEDLAGCFQSIWYPSADDIDIFDSTFSWIVSVSHSGDVKSLLGRRN